MVIKYVALIERKYKFLYEKIKRNHIFFYYIDNAKLIKRGRVPKGFLSSNTAYMLVYKNLTTDWRTNATKKMKLKKSDTEANISSNTTSLENFKDKMDIVDETKLKNDTEDAPLIQDVSLIQEGDLEKISKLELENKTEIDEAVTSQKIDMIFMDKNKTIENVDTNGCKNKYDSLPHNKIQSIKQPIVKVVKLDYKQLNGAAHRAMSCGERDFYEEVCFLNIDYFK